MWQSQVREGDQVAAKATILSSPTVMLSLLSYLVNNCCANTHVAGEVSSHLDKLKAFGVLNHNAALFHILHDILRVKELSCKRDEHGVPQNQLRRQ